MNKDECLGCINIKQGNFPFRLPNQVVWGELVCDQYVLDTECCWGGYHGESVEVFYCPVCGRKLSELTRDKE